MDNGGGTYVGGGLGGVELWRLVASLARLPPRRELVLRTANDPKLSLLEGDRGRRRSATAAIRARHAGPPGLLGLARGPVHLVQGIAKERSNFFAGTITTRQEDDGCFVSARAIAG
jgi:hypothetical protein